MADTCKALDENTLAVTTSVSREGLEKELVENVARLGVLQTYITQKTDRIAELQAQIAKLDLLK